MQARGTLHILNYDILFSGTSELLVGDQQVVAVTMTAQSTLSLEPSTGYGGGWFAPMGGVGWGSGITPGAGYGGAYFEAMEGGGEGYAYVPPQPEWGVGLFAPMFGSGVGKTSTPGTGGGTFDAMLGRGYEELESGDGGGWFAEMTGVGYDDFFPGHGFLISTMYVLDGIRPFLWSTASISETLTLTSSITSLKILVESVIESLEITDSIEAFGDYLASAVENIQVNYSSTGQVVYVPDPTIPGGDIDLPGGIYIDTDDDGIDDVWTTGGGELVDVDGDGTPETWVTEIKVYVDTDGDGVQDTWVGGIGYVDTDNVTVDLPGNQIQVDTNGDGTPDTWLTGGEYYDTDGDAVDDIYFTDEAVYIDTDGDGTADTWVIGIGIYVDTDDDGDPDTWIYGVISIITPTETGYIKPSFDSTARVWVVNMDSGASVQYDGYGFISFFERDGDYYGVAEDGIYLLEGDDDAGFDIDALISFGTSSLGSKQKKGVTNFYVGASSDGKLILKIQVDGGTEYLYEARSSSEHIDQHRIDTGKGLVGNYFTMHLLNQDGDDFDIESISFDPIPLKRRI